MRLGRLCLICLTHFYLLAFVSNTLRGQRYSPSNAYNNRAQDSWCAFRCNPVSYETVQGGVERVQGSDLRKGTV